MKTKKIWFSEDYIYGMEEGNNTYRQYLLWYTKLRNASTE